VTSSSGSTSQRSWVLYMTCMLCAKGQLVTIDLRKPLVHHTGVNVELG
jgi:hypothetical protein